MIAGSRQVAAWDHARMTLITAHGWAALHAHLEAVYGSRLDLECTRRGMAVVDEGLAVLYPAERQAAITAYLASHPASPQEAWLERCYLYAETELAADLGMPVPLADAVIERYAHEWALLLAHAVSTDPMPKEAIG